MMDPPFPSWLLVPIGVAALLLTVVCVGAVVGAVYVTWLRSRPSDIRPGAGPFEPGPPGPELLARLGMADLVPHARDTVRWRVGAHEVVAARTDNRGWATSRVGPHARTSFRMTTSGFPYALVAVRLPGPLPTINVLRGGKVEMSHVNVESAAFNDARDIRTDDDRVAHAVMTPAVIALVQDLLPQNATVQIVGDHLISFRRGVPSADEVIARGASLVAVADAIPAFVFEARDG